ncbi:MAG TPA: flavin reductase family protein [Pseudonocardiaceae bacterium]|jgi:flavin reductase (DIM6/NTAB) family NADH-FMN oxidoreductase RutF|nr:flavin reductase family protein [Pseudonocardiaceae bacterium]
MTGLVEKAHRLLAPRIAYLIGTRDHKGAPNVIPVSNVTSVSTDPQQVALAIHKKWQTYEILLNTEGFTLSVPLIEHLNGVWILGARYSGYPAVDPGEKLAAAGLSFDYGASLHGPVLTDGIGWMQCVIIERIDLGGDHGLIFGQVQRAWPNTVFLDSEGVPHTQTMPLMQVTGNRFTTTTHLQQVPYYDQD